MNTGRYRSYQHALDLIDCLDEETLGDSGRWTLREFAQDLLLTREVDAAALLRLSEAARTALDELQGDGSLAPEVATHLWHAIFACGPASIEPDALGAPELLELA